MFVKQKSPTNSIFPTSKINSRSGTAMASIANKESKKPFDISNLMSPPELPPFESFAQSTMPQPTGHVTSEMRTFPGPNPPLSPPISPATKVDDRMLSNVPSTSTPVKDPILYPAQDTTNSPPQQPLFIRDESADMQRIINEHVVTRPPSLFEHSAPPQPEHYELALTFQSDVMKLYLKDRKAWLQRTRSQLKSDMKAAGARHMHYRHRPHQPILPAKPPPIRYHVQRIVKPSKASATKQTQASSSAPRPIRSHPSGPRPTAVRRVSATPDPSRRLVAPNREDKDFAALEDYCPPLRSLPAKSNSLKVDWKGAPIDLSNDAHRDLLHPDEVTLAANLRLDCATYLTSKRRMFIKRLECLRIGKEFRKTDAQQACKIDVNKASKLWTAFEKVGWLDKTWVDRFL